MIFNSGDSSDGFESEGLEIEIEISLEDPESENDENIEDIVEGSLTNEDIETLNEAYENHIENSEEQIEEAMQMWRDYLDRK